MRHALILSWLLASPSAVLPPHEENEAFRSAIDEGLASGGARVTLPEPTFRDGQTAEEQRAALATVAGSRRGAQEMMQASVSAPHKLLLRDVKTGSATIRAGDLYFILRGVDPAAIRPDEAFRRLRGQSTEAGNMRFEVRLLESAAPSDHEWTTHSTGRLLDRIAVETTDRVTASRSEDSLVFASRPAPASGDEPKTPRRWSAIALKATGDAFGPPQPYDGGIGYLKLTRLKGLQDAGVVEVHFAFAEPLAWFEGAPILRSKFGLVAQDQVRRLRRELVQTKR
jgi:hypothetical protein